jgi:phosphoenolpyruvate synthase/pyruvate phosphate dikinase
LCIPCIIGTKIATHVFKDGDIVEVDANKGIIKKNINIMINLKFFKEIKKENVAEAGGKGLHGEMTSAGIPVPPGFVVLSSAFDDFWKKQI